MLRKIKEDDLDKAKKEFISITEQEVNELKTNVFVNKRLIKIKKKIIKILKKRIKRG